jgi:hypothetical protein
LLILAIRIRVGFAPVSSPGRHRKDNAGNGRDKSDI